MKYIVIVWGGEERTERQFESNCRDSKRHIIEQNADYCEIYDQDFRILSAATRWNNGQIKNVFPHV